RYFAAALQHDDRNVDALNGLAVTYTQEASPFTSANRAELVRLAEPIITKALALAPDSPLVHFNRAQLLELTAPDQALRECELAINLNPNFAQARAFAGLLKLFLGRAEETEEGVSDAIRLSPRDPRMGHWLFFIGAADLYLGRLDQAIDRLRQSV